jgi:hypothetical protein
MQEKASQASLQSTPKILKSLMMLKSLLSGRKVGMYERYRG